MATIFSLTRVRKKFASFLRDNEGASAIEYAIIAGLIAVAIIAGASQLGGGIGTLFEDIAAELEGVVVGGDGGDGPGGGDGE